MVAKLRVGGAYAYQLYREVEPVPPYPRIDPQQPRHDYPQQQNQQKNDKDDHARRRFQAMRNLIDELQKSAGLARVDYTTTATELNDLGFLILERELLDQLLELKIPLDEIEELVQQIRQKPAVPELAAGHFLAKSYNCFPIYIAGISEYNLHFHHLKLPFSLESTRILEGIKNQGHFISEKNRLRLDFREILTGDIADTLQLNISVLVAVSEVDDEGRRVILYQRPDQSYALYTDKQIDLSI